MRRWILREGGQHEPRKRLSKASVKLADDSPLRSLSPEALKKLDTEAVKKADERKAHAVRR